MEIKVNSRHGSVRPEVEEHIREKSEKILTYFERVTQIEVVVDFEHEKARVEILVDAEHRHDFVASDEHEEVAVAFDSALHKIEHQIRKYKDKVQNHRRDTPMAGPTE
ncbi:ribosome-associated translation inhibitor RaiA [bacterium]|nr:ribosome-associated translation inhibitor RaiA [bacterium]